MCFRILCSVELKCYKAYTCKSSCKVLSLSLMYSHSRYNFTILLFYYITLGDYKTLWTGLQLVAPLTIRRCAYAAPSLPRLGINRVLVTPGIGYLVKMEITFLLIVFLRFRDLLISRAIRGIEIVAARSMICIDDMFTIIDQNRERCADQTRSLPQA